MGAEKFHEQKVAQFNYPFGVSIADFNNDGLNDIVVPDVWRDDAFETNNGIQVSGLYLFLRQKQGGYKKITIDKNQPGFYERHSIGDVNRDGWLDIVIVNNRDGEIYFFENHFAQSKKFKKFLVDDMLPRAYDVELSDLDNDGDLDIAASGYYGGEVAIYKNTPGGLYEKWPKSVLMKNLSHVRNIRSGDVDGDGDLDLLLTSSGDASQDLNNSSTNKNSKVFWLENPGSLWAFGIFSEKLWKENSIETPSHTPMHGDFYDVDGDNDLDVIMAFGGHPSEINRENDGVYWFENQSTEHSWFKRIFGFFIFDNRTWKKRKVGKVPYAFEVIGLDFNRDGVADLAATAHVGGDQVLLFKGIQSSNGLSWKKIILKEGWTAANQLAAGDLNGDSCSDIAAVADNGNGNVRQLGGQELRIWLQNCEEKTENIQ